ncbi:Phosphatidate phosphatase [Heracleum sosnowskyi]|uniref:Phosphatidate phosphatase n=1 Tax=Heracleum sosnowskyi TaxID=360622 RepID=A0AAD8JL30_9APIA|nr:Phosphatidate phosphatase [Heracleum sosnowskyi]
MFGVGKLGSYISRGVYTVSAPFHPFGGAVDIVVVEQQDGTFKSSPWYVRFGKFQGVLKAKEKAIDINVNGDDADFCMYLDHTGEAYFIVEVDTEEGDLIISCASSGEEMDEVERRPTKCKSWNEGIDSAKAVTELQVSNGTVVAKPSSRKSRFLGIFGKNHPKENKSEVEEDAADIVRAESLESAEIAADLLEVNWSTNLASVRKDGDNKSRASAPDILNGVSSMDILIEKDACLLEGGVTKVDNKAFRRQPTIFYETLETSKIDLNDYNEQDNDILGSGGASMQTESFDPKSSTEATSEVKNLLNSGILGDNACSDGKLYENEESTSQNNRILTETCSGPVNVDYIDDAAKQVDSISTLTISSSNAPISSVRGEKSNEKEYEVKRVQPVVKPFCDSEEDSREFVRNEEVNKSSSVGLDEEQFPFSHLDDSRIRQKRCMEVIPIDHMDKEHDSSRTAEGIESEDGSPHSEFETAVKFAQEDLPVDGKESREKVRVISTRIRIPRSNKFENQELRRMVESLPNMRSHFDELDKLNIHHRLGHSLDTNPKLSKWASVWKNHKSSIKSDEGSAHSSSNSERTTKDASDLVELKASDTTLAIATGDTPQSVECSSSGRWGIWPFKRSSSMIDAPATLDCSRSTRSEISLESTCGMDKEGEVHDKEDSDKEASDREALAKEVLDEEVSDKKVPDKKISISKAKKKGIRVLSPTTEQLASLNLKEGRNIVTFTFSTPMLGKQQVDARIYLWRWDTRIVITDVDGTITKSDVLGQFMPLVGKDWSQTGVAHLFTAIKENGYQLLFLSARAISQAGITRQFLFNLKQDGKVLPDGPVVISPDGLFPSLFREVIRRAPHEFKIGCLEDIKACFPSDRNPFYAGFGNRDTDEFSYLKVGIPKGKIFIINPKGEVVVNRCDKKSYTSLHALVNGMFPPTPLAEQEDFNSWNFWKLPPPAMDM